MKYCLLLVMLCCGCAYSPVDVSLSEIRHHDDAPVVLSGLVEAVTPGEMPESGLRALILPFALRQDIAVRKDVGREMADIFRLAWLNRRVFEVMEYEPSAPWPGLGLALAQARAKGANILVSGNISQYYVGGRTGRTSIGDRGDSLGARWKPDLVRSPGRDNGKCAGQGFRPVPQLQAAARRPDLRGHAHLVRKYGRRVCPPLSPVVHPCSIN